MALFVPMLYSMCMHSCLNTCLRENMRLNCLPKYVGMHACIHTCEYTCVVQWLYCMSQPTQKSMSVCVVRACKHPFVCVHVCMWTVFQFLQGSAPYLALAVGGVQQVPNCCHLHNGFYKPGAGTGPWLSCRLGSPPLYPCHLHWRSSQSVRRRQISVQL